jgi:hypothetical protein
MRKRRFSEELIGLASPSKEGRYFEQFGVSVDPFSGSRSQALVASEDRELAPCRSDNATRADLGDGDVDPKRIGPGRR